MEPIYIVSAKRTPVGKFQGALKSLSAPQLGAVAIRAALDAISLDAKLVEEVLMGQVLTAGSGQAPARQAALYAQLPNSAPALTVGKVCGSGLKAVALGAQSILCGDAEIVVAGGQESMSNAPYLLPTARDGMRMGHKEVVDSMILDGLWDPYNNLHMGSCAEACVREYQFSRAEQDDFAVESYHRARTAMEKGWFDKELAPVIVTSGKVTNTVRTDEEPLAADLAKIAGLRPAFDKEGTITAGNASKINDGAAALILASASAVKKHGLKPMARIVSWSGHAQEPKWFTIAPVGAIQKALKKANLSVENIDLFEINEAFAAVTLAAMRTLNIPHARVNVHGGACAIGHPIGASGARVLTTLLHALQEKNKKHGLATLCIGGGEGFAMVVERI